VKESPVSVMVRGLLEKALSPQILDELFERSAKTQYTRELLFSTVVNLMSLVVCGVHPSVHAAHQASSEEIGVSVTSVYNAHQWHRTEYLWRISQRDWWTNGSDNSASQCNNA
jgi:hypothetical protein